MNQNKYIILIFSILILIVLVCILNPNEYEKNDDKKFIGIARLAIAGKIKIPTDSMPTLTKNDDEIVIIWPTNYPPRTLGGEYHAKVTIHRSSERVLEILGSP